MRLRATRRVHSYCTRTAMRFSMSHGIVLRLSVKRLLPSSQFPRPRLVSHQRVSCLNESVTSFSCEGLCTVCAHTEAILCDQNGVGAFQ